MMIQDWRTHFERCRHTHAIDFGQDVPWKVGLGVEVEQATQPFVCGRIVEITLKRVQRRYRTTA